MQLDQIELDDRRQSTSHQTMTELVDELPPTLLLERLSIPVLGMTAKDTVEFANASCAALLGHTRQELASMTPQQIFRGLPDDQRAMEFVRENSEKVVELRHSNGGLVHAIVSQSILRRDSEDAALVTFTDVSEQARPTRVGPLTLVG